MPRGFRLLVRILVSGLVGAVAEIAVAFTVIIIGYAALWILVFGDDTWPASANLALLVVGYGAGLAVFVGAICLGVRSRPR